VEVAERPSLPVAVSRRVEEHPAVVYLARLAPSGRRSQRSALTTIAGLLTSGRADVGSLPWQELRYVHTQAVRTLLADRYAPATVNRQLSALRGVLRECWRLGLTSAEDYRRAADLEPVRGSTLPAGRALTSGELAALFASCAGGRAGDVRDAALLAVLYGAGLRRAEAVGLDLDDYDRCEAQLAVRRGKGHKARMAYATGGTAQALDGWLGVRGDAAGPLFCPVDKAGRVRLVRLSGQAVRELLVRRAGRAGVAAFSPHDLRRTFISDLLDRGADLAVAQQLAGHTNPATTVRYDRRPAAVRRQTAGLLHVPYVPPPAG
jgi:integrase/recombinase XerD